MLSAKKAGLIDSHCHLTDSRLMGVTAQVLRRCREAGVAAMITIGTDVSDHQAALALVESHPGEVFAALGFHPHEAAKVAPSDFDAWEAALGKKGVVALGEMGLDYHYDFAPREVQKEVFHRQLAVAERVDLPMIIHCREAFEDLSAMLLEHGHQGRRVVFHCFTGTAAEARIIAEHGWRISFTGIVTFKSSHWLQEIAIAYPLDQMMIETDSPYLSPEPVRSQRPNEPANVAYVAAFLARLRGLSLEDFAALTAANTRTFFGLAAD